MPGACGHSPYTLRSLSKPSASAYRGGLHWLSHSEQAPSARASPAAPGGLPVQKGPPTAPGGRRDKAPGHITGRMLVHTLPPLRPLGPQVPRHNTSDPFLQLTQAPRRPPAGRRRPPAVPLRQGRSPHGPPPVGHSGHRGGRLEALHADPFPGKPTGYSLPREEPPAPSPAGSMDLRMFWKAAELRMPWEATHPAQATLEPSGSVLGHSESQVGARGPARVSHTPACGKQGQGQGLITLLQDPGAGRCAAWHTWVKPGNPRSEGSGSVCC